MKKFLTIILCLLLVGCNGPKTRGLTMEINLESVDVKAWRCQSDNYEIIKVIEENYIEDKTDELKGQYQFRFVGVNEGETTITCNCLVEDEIVKTGIYYVSVDNNQFIKYLHRDSVDKLPEPVFK